MVFRQFARKFLPLGIETKDAGDLHVDDLVLATTGVRER